MLATAREGHPNDSVTVAVSARTKGIDLATPSAQVVARQLDLLYLRATGSVLTTDAKTALMEAFHNYANTAAAESDWYQGHCDQGGIWGWEQRTQEENERLFSDPSGGMQAWTLMLHALMTTYSYLHD
jgi:1,2-phenylacetyl-CoA epoxidase PaaB subunit